MVKKGSFLSRLRDRWRSSSGMRVEAGRRGGDEVKAPANRMAGGTSGREALRGAEAPAADRQVATGAPAEVRSTRKMTDREEAVAALGEHFQELAGLMRGVQSRMDGQTQKLQDAADSLRNLPALGNRQLDLLKQVADRVERQNQVGENLARSLAGLPELLGNVEKALQRAAATDERTANTVREFQSTMDRIQGQMGKMVEHSAEQAAATRTLAERREESLQGLAQQVEQGQKQAVQELRRTTDEGLASLRRSNEDQSNRLHKVVEQHSGWNRAVLAGLGLVLLGMVVILVVLLAK